MGIGTSIFLIALGAILRFAVTAEISGVDIQVIGTILMVVGAIGAVLSLIFWSSWGWGFGRSRTTRVERRDGTSTYRDDDIDRAA